MFRALVVKTVSDSVITVKYFDYGNEEDVAWADCSDLPADLVQYPPQALSAALAGELSSSYWAKMVAQGDRALT